MIKLKLKRVKFFDKLNLPYINPHYSLTSSQIQSYQPKQQSYIQLSISINMLKNFKQKRVQQEAKKKDETGSQTAEQRMKKDILRYQEDKIANVEISYPDEHIVTELYITIFPTETSIYANSKITFSYKAPADYPFSQPEVKCLNKILHPNIDKQGNVCLSILREGWKANYELYQVVVGLLHLLQHIDAKDLEKPLDADAAELMNKNYEEFKKVVQETIKGGKYAGRQYDNVHYVPKKK